MMTFCNTCNSVTLQRISGPASHLGQALQGGTNATPISTAVTMSGDPFRRTPAQDYDSDDALWKTLQSALTNNGITLADLFRCDAATRLKLLTTLGFTEHHCERLVHLSEERDPRKVLAAAASDGAQKPKETAPSAHASEQESAVGEGNASNRGVSASSVKAGGAAHSNNGGATAGGSSGAGGKYTSAVARQPSAIKGLSVGDDGTMIARCTVYPHLPAEFWCSQCGVLVSSRCHVTGAHKDHPFITLRIAAESHIQELSTWAERCRNQLNVAENIAANLNHAGDIIRSAQQHEEEKLDKYVEEMIEEMMKWRDELKESIRLQTQAQVKNIGFATTQLDDMIAYYAQLLHVCDPLMSNIPPVEQNDQQSDDWALRVVDLVSRLKTCSREPIPLPRLTVPEVKCFATPASYMELLKAVSMPVGVRIPDIIDTGYLGFPTATSSSRTPFTLQTPSDAKEKGILVYSNRTLTRSQDIIPAHALVTASQVFFTGVTAWEVHVDRIGAGPGRILAGVLISGTDGEGVVWDGRRIVGPNEGECRMVEERFTIKTGTTLRFVLELDSPAHFLNCFFEREPVARVPLPPTNHGWTPAFSVFGPQDQVTVVPMSTTSPVALKASANEDEETGGRVAVRLAEQEQMIGALQQQLLAVNSRIDQEQYQIMLNDAASRSAVRVGDYNGSPRQASGGDGRAMTARSENTVERFVSSGSALGAAGVNGQSRSGGLPVPLRSVSGNNNGQQSSAPSATEQGQQLSSQYSPELKQLLTFLDTMKH